MRVSFFKKNLHKSDQVCEMDSLKSACLTKNFKSFKELAHGEYIVNRFMHVDTKHGKRVRIDLEEFYMYLPERFSSLTEADINSLNASQKIMVYSGKDASKQNRLILDFQEPQTYFSDKMSTFNN